MTTATMTAPRTAHPIEHFARVHHRTLERWLFKSFSRQLNDEDISDVLAETYRAALESEETASFDAERMSAWAYQVARFRAIAVLRQRNGDDRHRRLQAAEAADQDAPAGRDVDVEPMRVVISLDQDKGAADDEDAEPASLARLASDSAYAELADTLSDEARAEEARRVAEALLRLPEDQREALQYVHIDGLSMRAAAELLGTSKSTFDRVYRRALSRLQTLCATEQDADCAQARALTNVKTALATELVGWRDAHIEGCFACQVATGRRVKLILPLAPIIAAARPGWLARVGDRVTQLLSRGDAMPSEAVAAGLGTAGAGGTVAAGGTLLGGAATKVAACAVAATCAAGAVTVPAVVSHKDPRRPAKTVTAKATVTPRATSTPAATPVATIAAPAATVAASTAAADNAERRATNAAAAAAAERARARRAKAKAAKAKAAAAKRKASTDSSREFSPESFAAPAPTAAPTGTTRARAASGISTTQTTPSSSPSKSSSQSTSSFSQEFRP